MFNERFSHGKKFNINSDDFEFTTLDNFVKENGLVTVPVKGLFTYKGKYSVRPVLISNDKKITLPDHCLNDVETIMFDDDCVAAINNGKCGFKITQYTDKNGNVRNSGTFVDM